MLLSGFRRSFPNEKIAVEEVVTAQVADDDDEDEDRFPIDRPWRDRPDIRVGDWLWVEVETLRGLSLYGSNPFFELEAKLRPKLENMATAREIWLIVPSDLAMLANDRISAMTRN